jgi:hypothetical protein
VVAVAGVFPVNDDAVLRLIPLTVLPAIVPLNVHPELQEYVPLTNSLPSANKFNVPDVVVPLTVPVTGTPPNVLPVTTLDWDEIEESGAESFRSYGSAALDAADPFTANAKTIETTRIP